MKRRGDTLYEVLDQYTSEYFTYSKVTTYIDGTTMTDAKADGVIYKKIDSGEYFKRNWTGAANIRWFGAKGDGITDDTDAIFNKAFKCKFEIGIFNGVFIVKGTSVIDNPDLVVYAANATIKSGDASYVSITSNAFKSIKGLKLDRCRFRFITTYSQETFLEYNTFTGSATGAIYGSVGGGSMPKNITARFNTFDGHNYGIYGYFSSCNFSNNKFRNSTSRNIELGAGSDNTILDNDIDGGVTGITALTNRSIAGKLPFINNRISRNKIRNITEEAISLDCHGNNADDTGTVINGTIASVSSVAGFVAIVPSFTYTAYQHLNYYAVFLSGKAKGRIREINYMGATGNSYLRLRDETTLSDYTAGDKFVIIIPHLNNDISHNDIDTVQTGISLWGNGHGNKIYYNTVRNASANGISVRTLFGMVGGEYAPCFNNITEDNTLVNSNLNINAITYNTFYDVLSVGNITRRNNVLNGAFNYKYQEKQFHYENVIKIGTVDLTTTGDFNDDYGASVNRNPNPIKGKPYFDTTLDKPIWWNGTVWKDATGTTV